MAYGLAAEAFCLCISFCKLQVAFISATSSQHFLLILKFTQSGRRILYMDTYHTIEEKYLQAIDELNYGDSPKALQILNEIVAHDPTYARAHYQLGLIHYYNIEDYNAAGYHLKTCTELEPNFPDVYYHYLKLIVFLNKSKLVASVAAQASKTPGVYP